MLKFRRTAKVAVTLMAAASMLVPADAQAFFGCFQKRQNAAAALYGLQILFARFEWLYVAFRVGGALYLLYLAYMLIRHAGAPLPEADPASVRGGAWHGFTKALLLQLSNPKVMVFMGSIFVSLLPAQPPAWMDATVLAIVAFNEFAWFALLALLFSGETARAFYRRTKLWLDRIMGGALGLLGLKLAFDR